MEDLFFNVEESPELDEYLDDSTIIDSVHESSEFFNIDDPAVIQYVLGILLQKRMIFLLSTAHNLIISALPIKKD